MTNTESPAVIHDIVHRGAGKEGYWSAAVNHIEELPKFVLPRARKQVVMSAYPEPTDEEVNGEKPWDCL